MLATTTQIAQLFYSGVTISIAGNFNLYLLPATKQLSEPQADLHEIFLFLKLPPTPTTPSSYEI